MSKPKENFKYFLIGFIFVLFKICVTAFLIQSLLNNFMHDSFFQSIAIFKGVEELSFGDCLKILFVLFLIREGAKV